jgi:arylsulfatase
LAEICGVDLPDVFLDGVSIVDVLVNNGPAPRERFYWQLGGGENFQWAVRDGRWKLIGNPVDTTLPEDQRPDAGRLAAPFFLSDLESDISERDNLANDYPDVVVRLKLLRDELLKQ